MGYQALLFCPDEKTARTVTQVLSELEFAVEPCTEPFAAVKKLMAEHFDALVVDCDNEQNAALLFKSARNSTSNQAALAVAVVEGQAGVAKAFRIGANLVLTKPINVEQAKGTLRVARGLLRKGEPGKAIAPVVTQAPPVRTPLAPPAPAKPAPTAATPATPRPVAPKPVAPPHAAKPAAPATWPGQETRAAVASSAPVPADDDNVIEIFEEKPAPQISMPAPAASAPPSVAAQNIKPPVAARPTPPAAVSGPSFAGAASAPAPARIPEAALLPQTMSEQTAELVASQPVSSASSVPAPSFSFGGANVPESSGGSKKVLIGIAAAVVLGAALYIGWTQLHGKINPSVGSNETTSEPAAPSQTQPALHPAPVAKTPASSAATALVTSPDISIGTNDSAAPVEETQPVPTKNGAAGVSAKSAKASGSTVHGASKSATAEEPEAEPMMIKNGSQPPAARKSAATDTAAAPSMAGIAAPSSTGSLSNLIGTQTNTPKPVLEAMTISQGVSQGLLIKRVQPTYPPNAMRMRIEGSVQLLATISRAGNITAVKVVSGEPLLTRAASDAVKQWKYKPYLLNGEPVEIQTQITVNFKLPK